MSAPGEGRVSRACLQAGSKNTMCQGELKRELSLLEKEKNKHIQHINHEAKQLRELHAEHLPGSRPSSGVERIASAKSPRRTSPCTPHGSPPYGTPKEGTSHPRPVSPRLLPRRKSAGNYVGQTFVTDVGSHVLHQVSMEHGKVEHHGDLPQIIVSDEADRPVSRRGSTRATPLQRRSSLHRSSSRGSSHSHSGSDSGSEYGSPLSQSLNLPSHRPRSHSMPPGMAKLPSIFEAPRRRPSYCPEPNSHSSELHVPESPRIRSSSFSGIVPSRRRGSISEQWGSISERKRPLMGSFKGRKISLDMEHMLRDLTFGVQHKELMSAAEGASVSDKQWEDLKKCRYLRFPSRENSEEDVRDGSD